VKTIHHLVDNHDGWRLSLRQSHDPATLRPDRRPVAIVPGYGMNSFIFTWQPSGDALEQVLVKRGFEVWCLDLRGQGWSQRTTRGRPDRYDMTHLAGTDLKVALDYVATHTVTSHVHGQVDGVGCSLGGTLLCGHVALHADHRLGALVPMVSPFRWVERHPLVKAAFASPFLVGLVPFYGTRRAAAHALPVLAKLPWLLKIYIHPDQVDLSTPGRLAATVDDPVPAINAQIARWMGEVDLHLGGVNVSDGMARFRGPILCMVANRDGVVPRAVAESVLSCVRSEVRDLLVAGTTEQPFAHADMYVNRHAQQLVYEPLAAWLEARYAP
jgi:pimeloyl-ACP methyl ester carboxylesterase